MSRLNLAVTAERPRLRGRVMLSGPSGAGKTRTGLIMATVLAEGGPILVIDTERQDRDVFAAQTYADDFGFRHLGWRPPYNPRELAETITDAAKSHSVIQIDSGTHFWRKEGGTLDIADGRYTGWKEARPAQEDLVQAILTAPCHVIFCVRSKMRHEQVNVDGKWEVRKLGVGPVQDEDLEYDMNVSLTLDTGHTLSVSKSRSQALAVGRDFPPGHAQDAAELYLAWLNKGEAPAAREIVDDLITRMNALPDDARGAVKQEFLTEFGWPEQLREVHVAEAIALVEKHEAALQQPPGSKAPGARRARGARKAGGARKAAAVTDGNGAAA